MENENLVMEEEEVSILTLTDENGVEGTEYLVLMPEDSDELVILKVEPVDEETENYLAVEDEGILNTVFEIFKEKFKDVLEFEE